MLLCLQLLEPQPRFAGVCCGRVVSERCGQELPSKALGKLQQPDDHHAPSCTNTSEAQEHDDDVISRAARAHDQPARVQARDDAREEGTRDEEQGNERDPEGDIAQLRLERGHFRLR
eukprot:1613172-Rhodomonas_salina.1